CPPPEWNLAGVPAARQATSHPQATATLGVLVLWASTVGAQPYGCVSRDGRIRLLATSPAVCASSETPLAWDTVGRPPVRRRTEAIHPAPARVGAAALLAVFLLPRGAGR